MAYLFADRVQVTATASGTGSFSLGAAVNGYQNFSFLTTTGNQTFYTASDTVNNWEVGIGTYDSAGPSLSRTLLSSSTGSLISFPGTINVFCTYPAERAVLTDFTQTLSNKRINPRVTTVTGSITPNADTDDQFNGVSLSGTVAVTNPTGTGVDGQRLTLRLSVTSTAVTLTWGTVYSARGVTLPTTLTTFMYVGCIYNAGGAKWDVIAITGPG
jgi:hypothetical protein